jgi:hypothetical protein
MACSRASFTFYTTVTMQQATQRGMEIQAQQRQQSNFCNSSLRTQHKMKFSFRVHKYGNQIRNPASINHSVRIKIKPSYWKKKIK